MECERKNVYKKQVFIPQKKSEAPEKLYVNFCAGKTPPRPPHIFYFILLFYPERERVSEFSDSDSYCLPDIAKTDKYRCMYMRES
jgi:hypothetical protein